MREAVTIWRSGSMKVVEQDCACPTTEDARVLQLGAPVALDTDCACPAEPRRSVPSKMDDGAVWVKAKVLYQMPLVEGYALCFNPTLGREAAVLNPAAQALLESYQKPHELIHHPADRELADLGLLQPVAPQAQPAAAVSRTLTVWLHVTDDCNLRCRYCYADHSHGPMDERTGLAALSAIFATAGQHQMDTIKLKYAGGEPTLNFGLVRTLHESARRQAAAAGVTVEETLLSNGWALSEPRLAYLRDERIRLMISLDNISSEQDCQRPTLWQGRSVERVRANIALALAAGIAPHLSITITALNVSSLVETVDFALAQNLRFNLNFYRAKGADMALRPAPPALLQAMQTMLAHVAAQYPDRSLFDLSIDRIYLGRPHRHVCGAGQNYLVIDQAGRVARCQMAMTHAAVTDPTNDLLSLVREPCAEFQNPAVDERATCQTCHWRYWCAGGCPLDTYRTTGDWRGQSPYCEVYRGLLPELLRTEGMRLLQRPPAIC